MSRKIFHCIVDDTALITNIVEIEQWISNGNITLVIPLHTIERLHLLKKDSSEIGQNARKAVKFLDDVTSDPKLASAVILQESDEKYGTWSEVEAHYMKHRESHEGAPQASNDHSVTRNAIDEVDQQPQSGLKEDEEPRQSATSPAFTPPLSPLSSGPQSSKTSPDVVNAIIAMGETSPVPPSLKELVNSVVWYTFERSKTNLVFFTNSSDTSYLARDFGVITKNIHQLRASIGVADEEVVSRTRAHKKITPKAEIVPRTLFRYEDEDSEDEEVIFQPRGKSVSKVNATRGGTAIKMKNGHSPANSMSAQTPPRPQIPIEEIDPDSFDRGSFGRGSTTLAIVGNHTRHQPQHARGSSTRSAPTIGGHLRGNHRGTRGQGTDRGSMRGRGRLFVP